METSGFDSDLHAEVKQIALSENSDLKNISNEKQVNEINPIMIADEGTNLPNNTSSLEDRMAKPPEEAVISIENKVDVISKDLDTSQEKSTIVPNNEPTPSNKPIKDNAVEENIDFRHRILSSIKEGEVCSDKHSSLPVNTKEIEIEPSSGRRSTEPSINPGKGDIGKIKSIALSVGSCKDVEITRVVSSERERQSTRSGFGGTADFDGKKPTVKPSERLKAELSTGNTPHPLIILPDDGKFWCDPSNEKNSNRDYYISCFEMQHKDKYKDLENVIVNPIELAAEVYVKTSVRTIITTFVASSQQKDPCPLV